eukprot:228566_1
MATPTMITDELKDEIQEIEDENLLADLPEIACPSDSLQNEQDSITIVNGAIVNSYGRGQVSGVIYTVAPHEIKKIDIKIKVCCVSQKDIQSLNNYIRIMLSGNGRKNYDKWSENATSGGISLIEFLCGGSEASHDDIKKRMKKFGLTDKQISDIIARMFKSVNTVSEFDSKGTIYNENYDYPVSGSIFVIVMDLKIVQGNRQKQLRYIGPNIHLSGTKSETLPIIGKLY